MPKRVYRLFVVTTAKAKAEGKEYNFNPVNVAINIIIGGLFGSIEAIKGNFKPTDIEFQKAVELQKKLQSGEPNAVIDAVAFSNTHSSLLKKFNAEAQSPEARQVNAGVNEWNSAETTSGKDLPKWPETFEDLLVLPEKPQATPGELPDLASNGLMGYNEGAGENIIGTTHNTFMPTQEVINQQKVAEYSRQLKAGEKTPPVQVIEVPGRGRYIIDGHHRYVASLQTGIPVEIKVVPGQGPIGMPDWSNTQWREYINEDQFWGD